MDRKDWGFLMRADRVTANYQRRIKKLESKLGDGLEAFTLTAWANVFHRLNRLKTLKAEYKAHQQRVKVLREQHAKRQALNRLCRDANRLAGTAGANFFTKAGKVLTEETNHEKA